MGWLTPKLNFHALWAGLSAPLQSAVPLPTKSGAELVPVPELAWPWGCCWEQQPQHRSRSWITGPGFPEPAQLAQHREQTKPRKTSTNVSCHQVIILPGSSFPLQQRIYSVRAAVQAGPGSLKSPILGPLSTTLSALATKLHKGFYPILLIFCLTMELKVRAALS